MSVIPGTRGELATNALHWAREHLANQREQLDLQRQIHHELTELRATLARIQFHRKGER